MEVSLGFEDEKTQGNVWKLKKKLYMNWNRLQEHGLKGLQELWSLLNVNKAMLIIPKYYESKIIFLIIYVDDIVVIRDGTKEITRFKEFLTQEFEQRI